MIRFSALESTSVPNESQSLVERASAEYGFVPNFIKGMASAPEAIEAYMALSRAFESSTLSPEEQQVVLLTTSRFNECEYCTSLHTWAAESTALEWKTIESIRNRERLENDRYEALRRFTERVVKNGGIMPQDEWSQLMSVGFDVRSAVDVVLGVTLKTLTNSLNHLIETPLDEPFAKRAWSSEQAEQAEHA